MASFGSFEIRHLLKLLELQIMQNYSSHNSELTQFKNFIQVTLINVIISIVSPNCWTGLLLEWLRIDSCKYSPKITLYTPQFFFLNVLLSRVSDTQTLKCLVIWQFCYFRILGFHLYCINEKRWFKFLYAKCPWGHAPLSKIRNSTACTRLLCNRKGEDTAA